MKVTPGFCASAALPYMYSVVDRNRHELYDRTQRSLDVLIQELPRRFAVLEARGLPDTLVHGDFHPGNVRGMPGRYWILDWSDCGIGNPMLDLPSTVPYFSRQDRLASIDIWQSEWSRAMPGCEAGRAADLVSPLGPIFGAVVSQKFLDNIETSERSYHEGDPARALRSAVELATAMPPR